jgi:hypothetical protein
MMLTASAVHTARKYTEAIWVTPEFKNWVKSQGRKGESYEEILRRMLDMPEEWVIHENIGD